MGIQRVKIKELKKTFWGNLHIYGTDWKGRTNVNLSRLRHAAPFKEIYVYYMSDYRWSYIYRLSQRLSGKESICLQCRRHRRHGFNPCGRKIPWRRAWQPTTVFLPEESHGQRNLEGYSPWGHKELDTTGRLNNNNTIHEDSTLMTRSPQKPGLIMPSHWRLGLQHVNFVGAQMPRA